MVWKCSLESLIAKSILPIFPSSFTSAYLLSAESLDSNNQFCLLQIYYQLYFHRSMLLTYHWRAPGHDPWLMQWQNFGFATNYFWRNHSISELPISGMFYWSLVWNHWTLFIHSLSTDFYISLAKHHVQNAIYSTQVLWKFVTTWLYPIHP